MTAKINAARQSQGASALVSDSNLVEIARRHSARMAKDQRYYHNANLRNELPSGWRSEGENVGWATDCSHMHNFFMNSPSHRKNILNAAFNRIGVGVVTGGDGKLWVTEVFTESSGSGGLSMEPKQALNAPPARAAQRPTDEESAEAVPENIQKPSLAKPAQKPAGNPSPASKAAVRGKSSSIKTASPARKPGIQTLVLQPIGDREGGWDEPLSRGGPMVFDLEPAS